MGIGFTSKLVSISNAFRASSPAADYERAKKDVTRKISGGGISQAELYVMSHEADRAMEHIKISMKGMK